MYDIKAQFSIFQNHLNLVYLDNAASTQTPQVVLDVMDEYYQNYRANIHRGLYDLSQKATEEYEKARAKVARFINAQPDEIIFTSGTTHGLNLLAASLGKTLKPGENIVLTRLEHHANLVPWQMVAKQTGVELRFIELNNFELDFTSAQKLIDKNTKIVSFALVSNVLGTISQAHEITQLAKNVGATTIIDAAQAVAHMALDVTRIEADFLVFSGHKMYGPTGIGVLYGKKTKLEQLEPYFYGGDMIREVTYDNSTWADVPERFEGGTPNIAGAIGLGAAVGFIESIGSLNIIQHELKLSEKLFSEMQKIEGVKIIGSKFGEPRIGVISFTIDGVHPHDVAEILNRENMAIRAGHHCCMPLMKYLGLPGTNRVSIGIYNTEEDIDKFIAGLKKVKEIFQ